MYLPTAWNINDKSDYLNVNSDGLVINYIGKVISSCCLTVKILYFCMKFYRVHK